jgi:hypothetical protein
MEIYSILAWTTGSTAYPLNRSRTSTLAILLRAAASSADGPASIDQALMPHHAAKTPHYGGACLADIHDTPSDNVTLGTYHAWFAEPIDNGCHLHPVTASSSA